MSSKRIYITLNDKKEKDRIILDYLSNCYSESDAIKECLYQIAMNRYTTVQLGTDSIQTQKGNNSTEKVQSRPIYAEGENYLKDADSINKVHKGADNNKKDENVTALNSTEKVQIDEKQAKKEQEDAERRKKELDQLRIFM